VIALIIIAAVIVLIIGLLFLPVSANLSFEGDFSVKIKLAGIKLYDSEKKSAEKPKEKPEKSEEKKENTFSKLKDRYGFSGAVKEILGFEKASSLSFYHFYEENGVIVSRTGYTGEDGFEIYASPERTEDMWNTLVRAGVQPCGLGCRDTLRFEAGLPLYGDELSENISPVMAGLSIFCKMDKPDFIGKQSLSRQKEQGVERKLVGLEVLDRAIPRAGYPVENAEGEVVGVVTTGYHSISMDKSIAFAMVDSSYAPLGTQLQVRIRNKVFPAVVVKKRFYQTNYKK